MEHGAAGAGGGAEGSRAVTAGPRVLVVSATYNERENILNLVPRIFERAPGVEALIVDDNSPDGTAEAVEEMAASRPGLHLLRRSGKLGYGTALIAGIEWARERGFDAVVTMDADLSHDPDALPAILRAGRECPVVIGSRYVPGGRTVNWGLHRRLLSRGANMFVRFMLGVPTRDVTTGYRYLNLEAIRPARIEEVGAKGYGFLFTTLYRITSAGVRVCEEPITFVDRAAGKSKMSGDIIAEAFALVLKLWCGRVFGRKEKR